MGEADIKKAYESVDVDGSGTIDWNEFIFSFMGETATKYGVLADMEDLQRLLGNTLKQYVVLRDTLQEVRANNDTRAENNGRLRRRLENMKGEVTSTMNELFAK